MTKEEFKIYADEYFKTHTNIVNGLIELIPRSSTKEACRLIGCHRTWISKNRHLFDGRVINRRGDMDFDTRKLIQFKRDNNK